MYDDDGHYDPYIELDEEEPEIDPAWVIATVVKNVGLAHKCVEALAKAAHMGVDGEDLIPGIAFMDAYPGGVFCAIEAWDESEKDEVVQ